MKTEISECGHKFVITRRLEGGKRLWWSKHGGWGKAIRTDMLFDSRADAEEAQKLCSSATITPQPWHPVQHLAHWNATPVALKANIDRYNVLVGGDPEKRKMLDELIDWACHQAILDHDYNDGE